MRLIESRVKRELWIIRLLLSGNLVENKWNQDASIDQLYLTSGSWHNFDNALNSKEIFIEITKDQYWGELMTFSDQLQTNFNLRKVQSLNEKHVVVFCVEMKQF